MSDGNFNRALLPHTPYASGLKAGKQIAKMHAVETFKEILNRHFPNTAPEKVATMVCEFENSLSSK